MPGIKHLIECHCKLAIYKNIKKDVYHKFPVYSKINEYGKIIEKFRNCNNCEALHKIYDIGKSEIFPGKDQSETIMQKEDFKYTLSENIFNFLQDNNADISNYYHIKDIIDEKRWDENVVIKRDIIDEKTQIKYIVIKSNNRFEIKNAVLEDTIILWKTIIKK